MVPCPKSLVCAYPQHVHKGGNSVEKFSIWRTPKCTIFSRIYPYFLYFLRKLNNLWRKKSIVDALFASIKCSNPLIFFVTNSSLPTSFKPMQLNHNLTHSKVIDTKYSKHWPYTVAHTIECVCSKMNNSWFNPWFILLHTHSNVCATVEGRCLEYLVCITLSMPTLWCHAFLY